MAGLTEVAQKAGVSVSTASSVLNPGRKPKFVSPAITARVREVARELGYVTNYHARSMKLRRAQTIGVVLDMPPSNATPRTEMGSTFFGTLFGAVAVAARRAGYTTAIIGATEHGRATAIGHRAVQQRQLDGLVLLAMLEESRSDAFYTDPPAIPAVAIEPLVQTPLPAIGWDIGRAVGRVAEYLASLGHRRVLWLGPIARHGAIPAGQRETLLMRHLQRKGLQGLSCRYAYQEAGAGMTVAQAYLDPAYEALSAWLKQKGRPAFSALVCYNDATALGAYAALREQGLRIPEEVSVVGFDDTEALLAFPKLTTVRLPLEQLGEKAFAKLQSLIESPALIAQTRGEREQVLPELIVRHSTAPARA